MKYVLIGGSRSFSTASSRDFGSATFGNPRLGDVQRIFVNAETQVLVGLDLGDRTVRRVAVPRSGARWSRSRQ